MKRGLTMKGLESRILANERETEKHLEAMSWKLNAVERELANKTEQINNLNEVYVKFVNKVNRIREARNK